MDILCSRIAAAAAAIVALLPLDSEAAVGRTDAAYDVTTDGRAAYSIPIRATEGIGALTPHLAVTYTGPARRSVLGVGFELSGLSAVTPCRKTIVQDLNAAPVRLTSGDRFCLDGARLRAVQGTYGDSGAVYRTEIDRLVRVTSYESVAGIPGWFKVETRDGLLYEYGHTSDAKLLASAAAGAPPQFWALSAVSDRAGNSMTFHYDTDNAQRRFRPSYILYTASNQGAAHYRIAFVYQPTDRPDPTLDITPSATGGAGHLETRLLQQIELKHDDVTYRKYVFTYEAGAGANRRLKTVQECALTPSEDCLPATTFDWQSATAGFAAVGSTGVAVAAGIIPLDINGDGFEDVAWAASGTWRYMLGSASGYAAQVNTGITATGPLKAMPLEWDGDGMADLLVDWSDGKWRVLRGTASAGFASPIHAGASGSAIASNTSGSTWTIGDTNNDGRDDLIRMSLNAYISIWVFQNNSTVGTLPGFGPQTVAYSELNTIRTQGVGFLKLNGASAVRRPDFNGDGRTDLLVYACEWEPQPSPGFCVSSGWYQLVSNGSTYVNQGQLLNASLSSEVRFGDFNRDGLTDAVYPVQTCSCWYVGYGQGEGGLWIGGSVSYSGYSTTNTMTGDYDGDGYDDFYAARNSPAQWHVFRATGSTGMATTAIATGISTSGSAWMQTDANGDGLADVGRYAAGSLVWGTYAHLGVPAERLLAATDGLQNAVTFTYLPMTNATVYTKGTGALWPDQEVQTGHPLVRTMQISPAGATAYTFTYSYTGARINVQGRSSEGMQSRTVVDGRDSVSTTQTYMQEFPFMGAPLDRTVKQPSGTTILWRHNAYNLHPLDSTPGNWRWLPYLAQTMIRQYEVGGLKNGSEVTLMTDTRTVNTLGNITFESIVTTDKDSSSAQYGQVYRTEITSTYSEDTANWCLAIPKTRSEKRTLPLGADETRDTSWNVAGLECRITQETIAPAQGSTVSLVTDLGYDTCGNVNSITSYPAGLSSQGRTTGIGYGARCQRPESITNPENHTASIGYDYARGVVTSTTDPNGLMTLVESDGFGRMNRVRNPDLTATRVALTACSSGNSWCGKNSSARIKITQTARDTSDAVLRTDEQYLDGFGRVRWTHADSLESGPSIVERQYDVFGRLDRQSQPYFAATTVYWTDFGYDLIGRVTSVDAPIDEAATSGKITAFGYEGRDLRITDPLGATTTRTLNVIGQVLAVVDPAPGGTTRYEYHPFGELKSITDTANPAHVSTFTYNPRGLIASTQDPARGSWQYAHNAFGELTQQTNAKLQVVDFTYDKLSRLTKRHEVEGDTDLIWGTLAHNTASEKYVGQLKSVTSPGGYSENYIFDQYGRLSRHTTNVDGSAYPVDLTYGAHGLPATLEYPNSLPTTYRLKIAYDYSHNLLKRVRDANAGTTFWELTSTDAYGHSQQELFGNNVSTVTDFDQANGYMSGREGGLNGGTGLINLQMQWNQNGNLTQRQDLNQGGLSEAFYYDGLNRFDYSTRAGSINQDVTLDASGNIAWTKSVSPPTQSSSIGYTSYDLPSSIAVGGDSSTLSYGAWRNRFKQVANSTSGQETTIYIAGLLEKVTRAGVTEYRHLIGGANGTAALHTRRSAGAPANETFYVHRDHLGSPELISYANGTPRVRLSFGAFGERRDTDWDGAVSSTDTTTIGNTTREGFTGQEQLDAVGLVHMNGRVYDPLTAQFLSADPLIRDLYASQAVHPYAYVEHRPLSWIDPTGWGPDDADTTCLGDYPDLCMALWTSPENVTTRGESGADNQGGLPLDNPHGRHLGDWDSTGGGFQDYSDPHRDSRVTFAATFLFEGKAYTYRQLTLSIGSNILFTEDVSPNCHVRPVEMQHSSCDALEDVYLFENLVPIARAALVSRVARGAARATTDFVATRNGLVDVRSTIERIKAGGKFPHRNDGSIFQNREGLLPKQAEGYYREYVHPTPGRNGPGAQRIIQGQNGELYYSPDHYGTFIPLN